MNKGIDLPQLATVKINECVCIKSHNVVFESKYQIIVKFEFIKRCIPSYNNL